MADMLLPTKGQMKVIAVEKESGRVLMAYLRFHRSRSIVPGVRLNLSKSGPSLSIGPKGAKVNIGQHGVRTTVGIPGSGLSVVNQTNWKQGSKRSGREATSKTVRSLMDGMNKDQQRELFKKCISKATLADAKAQRDAFDAYVVEHASEIDEDDQAELADMRKIYADAISEKEAQASNSGGKFWVFVSVAALLMCGGLASNDSLCVVLSFVFMFLAVRARKAEKR